MTLPTRPLDVAAVGVYIVAMLGLGWYCSRRTRAAENYFVGGRNFSGWLVALSMLGAIVSSTTFLALPAAAFVLDWRQLTVNLVVPFVAILAVVVFIPLFRRGRLTSAFEYLGHRFGQPARMYGTVSFVFLQLIRVGQVLFLMSLPLQFLTGIRLEWVIVGGGVFVALFTIAGGMETVVWAGAVQALIMLAGAALCLGAVVLQLPGGIGQIFEIGAAHHKFSLGALDWNLDRRTFWTVLLLGVVNWLTIYAGEQTMVQRYVSASTLREARKATLIFSGIAVPMWTVFFFIGTALFVFFQVHPDPAVHGLQADQVLPYFVLKYIPPGLAGLVVAAVIAAAMNALGSGVNSIATVVVVDIVKPHLAANRPDRYYLKAARVVSALAIIAMMGEALIFSRMNKESMNDVSLMVFSLLGGALAGLYMVGFFTRYVDGVAANIALGVAIALNLYLGLGVCGVLPPSWTIPVHTYFITALVNATFVFVACGIGLFRRGRVRNLTGLTVWTMKAGQSEPPSPSTAGRSSAPP